jgi:dipeptidase E
MNPAEIDLRKYFDDSKNLEKDLRKYTAFWLAGGNVFLLRRAIRQSGAEPLLGDRVRKNELVLGGESAGAIIMGPTLKYSEVDTDEDSPNYIPSGYEGDVIWDGLDFINYVPVPHYQTPGYIGIDDYIRNLDKEKIPYKTMTDEQAILINGDKEEFLK